MPLTPDRFPGTREETIIKLTDVPEQAHPSDGEGLLYKKTGGSGIFWRPDSAGTERDLTELATTEIEGIIRIATLDEVDEGASRSIAVTPYDIKNFTEYAGTRYWTVALTNSSGLPYQRSTSETYEIVAIIPWLGSDLLPDPEEIYVNVRAYAVGTTMDVRIYDRTNMLTIAELIGIADRDFTLRTMGTISNVDTGPAAWEVQIRGTGGGRKSDISSVTGI